MQKRLVLLITDGEPADIDERDPQYLRHDAKKAVEDLAMQGHLYLLPDPRPAGRPVCGADLWRKPLFHHRQCGTLARAPARSVRSAYWLMNQDGRLVKSTAG